MTIIGLSILIASVSFLCYRHPPTSWSFFSTWLGRPSTRSAVTKNDAPAGITGHDGGGGEDSKDVPSIEMEDILVIMAEESTGEKGKQERRALPPPTLPLATKADQDRKAMPPPAFKIQKPASAVTFPTTPRASVPSFALSGAPPSFPEAKPSRSDYNSFAGANSAQRVSGGINGPPRLNSTPTSPGLMAPPMRSPLPNRGPPSSSLAPPPTHTGIPAKPRRKVLLTPGHSPLDWARLTSSPSVNLRGLPASTPYLRVPPSLLKQYTGRKGKDAWTVLGGKVYNITPYLPYHPGGEPELLRAAGRDGTRLFGEVHPWVNWEGMLEGCLVGIAVEEGEVAEVNKLDEMD